jgi:hypothetical protein
MKRLLDLDAYATGEMSDADADAFEEAMFDAPDDANVTFVDRFVRHGAKLAEHGTFDVGVTRAHIDALIAAGHKVQIADLGPAGTGKFSIAPEADLIATRIQLGRTDIDRADVEFRIVEHDVAKVLKDCLVDQTDGSMYGLCERPLAELAFGAGRTIVTVRRRDGAHDVLGIWDVMPSLAPA